MTNDRSDPGHQSSVSGNAYSRENRLAERTKVVPEEFERLTKEQAEEKRKALARQKEQREQKPFFYCAWITKYPRKCFFISLACHIFMFFISIVLVASGYDLLPIYLEDIPLVIRDEPWKPRSLAWKNRDTFANWYDRDYINGITSYRTQVFYSASLVMYYDTVGGDIFTKANLQKIQEIENKIVATDGYANYCQVVYSNNCYSPLSIIRYFDGSYASANAIFNDPNFNNIAAVLYEANTNSTWKGNFQFFVAKDAVITSTSASASMTRSFIPIGYPIEGAATVEDAETKAEEFLYKKLNPVLENIRSDTDEFEVTYYSRLLWGEVVRAQAMIDLLWAVGSIMFIFWFILFHTRSLWVSGLAIFSIIASLVGTNLIYRVVLDFRYIGFLHIVIPFIVVGIGADDIFILYDAWRSTGYHEYPSLAHRLSDAYRNSAKSMFFTSLTTAVAFFSSAVAPLLATRSFGIFAGIVILYNYISVIAFFPTVIIMYHTYFSKFKWPCIVFFQDRCHSTCCKKKSFEKRAQDNSDGEVHLKPHQDGVYKTKSVQTSQETSLTMNKDSCSKAESRFNLKIRRKVVLSEPETVNQSNDGQQSNNNVHKNGYINHGFIMKKGGRENPEQNKPNLHYGRQKPKHKEKLLVKFFRDKYFHFVTHKYARWGILLVMGIAIALFVWQTSRLEVDKEGMTVLKDTHVLRIAIVHGLEDFVNSDADTNAEIYIAWGMKQSDMNGCRFSEPVCESEEVWDDTFDPSTEDAQIAMKALCDKMHAFTDTEMDYYHIRKDITTGQPEVSCYMSNIATFLVALSTTPGNNWSLTWNYTKTARFLADQSTYYDASKFNSGYTHHFEIPISYWLFNKYSGTFTNDYYEFNHLIGEEIGTYTQTVKTNTNIKYGNNIKYVGIQINSTLDWKKLGYDEGIPILNRWEDFTSTEASHSSSRRSKKGKPIKMCQAGFLKKCKETLERRMSVFVDIMSKMPDEMKNGFQLTTFIWHWLRVQEILVQNAIFGLAIGISLAWPILVIGTRNIITGSLATFCMCCAAICVIGVVTLAGWKLGVLVTLNFCLVVGLSVDFVVHLAESYSNSLHTDRLSRTQDMLAEMGISIFSGACTTLGASMFMFAGQLTLLLQFGMFMFSTIGFSLLFSMGLFATLMGLMGPEGNTGNIVVCFKKIVAWCKNKRNNKTTVKDINVSETIV